MNLTGLDIHTLEFSKFNNLKMLLVFENIYIQLCFIDSIYYINIIVLDRSNNSNILRLNQWSAM